MYDKNVAVIGCTIEKTTKYDQFREDKIRMLCRKGTRLRL